MRFARAARGTAAIGEAVGADVVLGAGQADVRVLAAVDALLGSDVVDIHVCAPLGDRAVHDGGHGSLE